MGELLSYSITCGLVMLALYLAYSLCLARYNQHAFNRAVLIIIYVVSFAGTPALLTSINQAAHPSLRAFVVDEVEEIASADTPIAKPIWGTALIWIYLIGMAAVVAKTAITWIKLIKIVRKGEIIRYHGFSLVLTDDEQIAPFSWIRYVVINRKDYTDNCPAIAAHELEHIESFHWIDLLIAQGVCIVNWFNPASWLMRDELMLVHEYQADKAVIDGGHDARDYQMLLIKKAVGARFPSLANSLNHSKLKKRITMMYKEKSGAGRRLNALALVPMLALAIAVASVPAVQATVSAIGNSPFTVDKVNENPVSDKTVFPEFKVTRVNNDGQHTTVVLTSKNAGNVLTVSGGIFANDGKRYSASSLQTQLVDGEATITATFPFAAEFKNPGMVLTINGETVPFSFGDPHDSARTFDISSPSNADIDIYANGKKISREQLYTLSPEDISSITVDKQKNAIMIQLKK